MFVSTFELLVKRQLPKQEDIPVQIPLDLKTKYDNLSRTVIQGYFLTISNLNAFDVTFSLVFTIVSNPPVDTEKLVSFIDIGESNMLATIKPDFAPNKIRFTRTIPASDTGLFILQPNIFIPELLTNEEFESRGYVEIFISSLSRCYDSAKLLLTPEHRGSFYKNLDAEANKVQLDQIAYSLPTAHGGSLFELSHR